MGNMLLELKRQAVHTLAGLFVAAAVYYLKPKVGDYILLPMILIVVGLYVSPRVAGHLPGISHLIHHLEREEDKKSFPFKGAFWYNLGVIVPVILLPLNLACAIIVVLSVGDSVSTIVGKTYGRHRIGVKSVEGFLGFVVSSGMAASVLIPTSQAFMLALFGGLIELGDGFDDNFLIPVGLTAVTLLLRP